MREYRRKPVERPRLKLTRGVDGRLKSAEETGIADIWAEQKRIRLAEAILEDKQRTERKIKRQEALGHLKTRGLGAVKALGLRTRRVKLPGRSWLPKRLPSKRVRMVVASVVLVTGLASGAMVWQGGDPKEKPTTTSKTLAQKSERPSFATLLPEGKTLEELGGWQRVSPPDKEAVYAFVDTINGIQINVSQQPLPESFKKDTAGSLAALAKDFNANEKITVGTQTAYIGTSEKGPQSVIFAKDNLLILMRSSQAIPNDYWGVYINSLH